MSPETPPPAPIVSPVASQPNAVTNDAETLEAERCFELLATAHLADASVTRGTGFGSTTGLRVGGRIFAMLMKRPAGGEAAQGSGR